MKPVFADTSYYLALVNAQDVRHVPAVALSESFFGRIVLTEYVLVELGSALSRGSDRETYLTTLAQIDKDEDALVIPASTGLYRQGLQLFAARPHKDWSLVDCISFVVMKKRRLTDALTADHHFEQAGFKALLK